MKESLIVFMALFAIAGTASADRINDPGTVAKPVADDIVIKKAVSGIGDASNSPASAPDKFKPPPVSIDEKSKAWQGGSHRDNKKRNIGETEKNLQKALSEKEDGGN